MTVEYTISDVTLDKKEMKFRYSGDWGLEFPYQGGKVKLHTNMGYNGDCRRTTGGCGDIYL